MLADPKPHEVAMLKYLLVAIALALPATAQTAIDCDDWKSSGAKIVEPWDTHSRTLANGNVRVALMDMIEPAAAAFYLLVLSPPYDELGVRSCELVGEGDGGHGFHVLHVDQMTSSYDATTGLSLRIPGMTYDANVDEFVAAMLRVSINQATGDVSAKYETP